MSKRPSFSKFKKELLSDPKNLALYDELEEEYQVYRELISARKTAGLTQEEVAEKMGVKKPNIARLESLPSESKPSPTLDTLMRYARAVNCHIEIKLVPNKRNKNSHTSV